VVQGQVDCDKEKELAGKYKVEGFPTIKFFGTPGQHTHQAPTPSSVSGSE